MDLYNIPDLMLLQSSMRTYLSIKTACNCPSPWEIGWKHHTVSCNHSGGLFQDHAPLGPDNTDHIVRFLETIGHIRVPDKGSVPGVATCVFIWDNVTHRGLAKM